MISSDTRQTTRLFPIAKQWLPLEGQKAGRIAFDRDLPEEVVSKANSSFVVMANDKREGKKDADYRVFVAVEPDVYASLVTAQKAIKAARATAAAEAAPVTA